MLCQLPFLTASPITISYLLSLFLNLAMLYLNLCVKIPGEPNKETNHCLRNLLYYQTVVQKLRNSIGLSKAYFFRLFKSWRCAWLTKLGNKCFYNSSGFQCLLSTKLKENLIELSANKSLKVILVKDHNIILAYNTGV